MSTTNKKAYTFEMNIVRANILSIVIFIPCAVITFSIFGYSGIFDKPFFLTIMIFYFFLHEFLHGVGYYLGGCKRKNITYGAALEKGIFYCMSYQEITKKNILISLQMPFAVISVVTYVVAISFHFPLLAWLSVINCIGASMDMVMFYYIARIKNVIYSESGSPSQFVLITTEDLRKKKNPFLTLVDVKDYRKEDYQFSDVKKIQCSKASFYIILILILLDLLSLL